MLDEEEINANLFALELLVPYKYLIKKIEEFGLDRRKMSRGIGVNKLAKYFRVSVLAMYCRLTNLGLITTL